MFSIYTPAGHAQTGPLENLRRVEKTTPVEKQRRIVDSHVAATQPLPNDVALPVSRQAAQEYSAMLADQGHPEPVFQAYQIMTSPAVLLDSQSTLQQAKLQFDKYPYQSFPLVDLRRQLQGMLSRTQVYEALFETSVQDQTRERVANRFLEAGSQTYATHAVTDVRRLARLMLEQSLSAVPVVDDSGEVIGIVSRTDILRCASLNPPLSLWC